MCVTTLEKLRNENEFDYFWTKVKSFAKEHDIDDPQLPRRRKAPIRYFFGKAPAEHPESVEDDYRRKYYSVLDTVINCIRERFLQDDYEMYATLEQ